MNKRILKAIIANMIDHVHGAVTVDNQRSLNDIVYDFQLDIKQAEVAIRVTHEVAEAKDWLFNDDSDEHNMHVVRAFVMRQCRTDTHPEAAAVLPEMTGPALEAFIVKLHELVK